MRKRIASIVLSVCLCLTLLPTMALAETPTLPSFSGGTGTETDPFLLANADDLIALRDSVNAQTDDNLIDNTNDNCGLGCYHGYYFTLTKDIDMTGVTDWTPFNFCGTLDGAGHTISNMQMNQNFYESTDPDNDENKSTEYEAGFFNQLVHAHIKNLYFTDCTATVSDNLDPAVERDIYAAVVAGTAIASGFENVSVVNCTVSQNGEPENMGYTAGLVAYAEICHISNCSVQGGSINVGGSASDMYTGGLVGAVSDMYNKYITDYNNPFNMQVGAGKDFGIYNSFSTASISVQNATGTATGGLIGMVECWYLDFTCKNCMVGDTITASTDAAGLIGSCDTSKGRNVDTNAENCVIYSTGIQGGKYADYLYRPYGGKKDTHPVTFTNCKVSDATSVSVTDTESGSVTNYGEITPTALTEADCQVSDFKSNLHGKLTDGTQGVTITLSQNDDVKYTVVTDKDGEYNFGKQVLMGTYTLNIAERDGYEAYTDPSVMIEYAENQKKDITRQVISVTGVTLNKSELSMTVGGTETLTATVAPDGAANKTVTWASNPESVATVDESGVVTAVAAGTATITVTTEDDGFTATCTVTVSNPSSSSGGGGSSSNTTSTTVKNPDGSTTTTVTDKKTGTVTETTSTPNGTTSITVTDKNGNSTTTVSVSKKDAQSGETVTLPVDEVTAGKSEDAQEITVNVPSGGATVEIPVKNPTAGTVVVIVDKDGNETVVPTTKQTDNGVSVTLTEDATIKVIENSKDFSDVKDSDYFGKAVDWASSRGITGGNSATTFGPHDSCTRAQLVTFLWRAAGQPEAKSESGMSDVATNSYYTDAVAWAFENGIVGGYGNGLFGSDDTITREQMAVILYRFAQHTGMDTMQGGMAVREYKDFDSIAEYAVAAIQWAVNAGVMQGYDGNLMPNQPCTRAQIVTMLYRLLGE